MAAAEQELSRRIETGEAVVAVVGLGYVGLPLAVAFAEAGFPVLGLDTDPGKVTSLERGKSYLRGIPSDRVEGLTARDRLTATSDPARLSVADAVLVCVPTPLAADRSPDLEAVTETARSIRETLRPGQLVVLESTTYPGTTRDIVRPILESGGLRCGHDFFLAFSPEREDPGSSEWSLGSIAKVVGGIDSVSGELAARLYRSVAPEVVAVANSEIAEASKLTENIFRSVNIALVNELKMIFDRMGIDVWEVLDAAETKPFGYMRFDPGPGWGGHCIPIDPFYLAWKARQLGSEARFIELAGEINTQMPRFVVAKLEAALEKRGARLEGSSVLLIGLAYKKNVSDPRESPAFELIDRLRRKGARVGYHDPLIPRSPDMRNWPDLEPMASEELTASALAAHDAVVIVTDHDEIDYRFIERHARLIVDTRGRLRPPSEKVVPA